MEDAQLAVESGASAIGMVFWPESPRFVDPSKSSESEKCATTLGASCRCIC